MPLRKLIRNVANRFPLAEVRVAAAGQALTAEQIFTLALGSHV